MKAKEWKKWIFWFTFAVASIIVYKTIDSVSVIFALIFNLFDILMPFIMAILIAYMLYIPSKSIEETYRESKSKFLKKHARGLSVLTIYVIVFIILFIIINVVMPSISTSVIELANNLPNYYNSTLEFLKNFPKESIVAKLDIVNLLKGVETINISQEILNWFNLENINQYIKGIVDATGIIFDLFVTFVVSIYMLLERADIKSFLKNLSRAIFDEKTYSKISRYYNKTNKIFFTFVTSQIIDAFLVGTITAIVMSIMKIKYGVLLGVLIGAFNVIPYFGAIVAVIIAVLITIFTGGFVQAAWLSIVIIVIQQIDANIINPRILGTSLNLSPILVIFSVSIGGAYFGVLGMFLGVPVCALLKIILNDAIEGRNKENLAKKANTNK